MKNPQKNPSKCLSVRITNKKIYLSKKKLIAIRVQKFNSSVGDQTIVLISFLISVLYQKFNWLKKINFLRRIKPVPWRQLIAIALPLLFGCTIWLLPIPTGVNEKAWHLLAIFMATIVSFIVKPLPLGAVAIIALLISVLTNTLTIEEGLSGFSNTTSWLTLSSFLIARAIIKTGLAIRIGYLFMSVLGKNTLALSYGLLATDLILSPVMPSGNARSGGVIFPLVKSIASAYKSEPHDGTAHKIGSFLMKTAFQGTQITTAMFLTAMVANPLMAELAKKMAGINIDWITWAVAAFVPGSISLLVMPLLVYYLYPPEIKKTPEAPQLAQEKLAVMGKLGKQELLMVAIFIVLLSLWTFGDRLGGIETATTALVGVALLLVTKVLTWNDIITEKKAWDIFIWFSILLMMATYLNQLGFTPWISQVVEKLIQGLSWQPAFLALSLMCFYNTYFFASKTALASAMYPAFLSIALAVDTPPIYAALVLAFFMNLSGCLTHYGSAVAPMYFSAGYIELATWWKVGFILSLVYIPIWLIIGGIWWRVLGFL
jgi:DASS family divalent anion:Na+ symporter